MDIQAELPHGSGLTLTVVPPATPRVVTTAITLDGTFKWPLHGGLSWGYVSGTAPQQVSIPMLPEYAELAATTFKKRVALTMVGADHLNQQVDAAFQNLWLLVRGPLDYNHDTLLLVDDRYYWPRAKYTRAINVTRKSGDILVFDGEPATPRTALLEALRYFVPGTILKDENGNPLRPFTALDIVVDVLTSCLGYKREQIRARAASKSLYTPLNVNIEGEDADAVIQRYLELGGNNLYLDEKGDVVIYDARQPMGEADFKALFPEGMPQLLEGQMFVVDYKAVRPRYIEVQQRPELECLFTFVEGEDQKQSVVGPTGPATTDDQALQQLFNKRIFMENVTRTVVSSQVLDYPRGTVVNIEDAIAAFGAKFGSGALSMDNFRAYYGADIAAFIGNAVRSSDTSGGNFRFDTQAITAYSGLLRDYRSLFQVPRIVMEKILDINPVMVEVLNPQSGARAPSNVFSILSWVVNVQYRYNGNREQAAKLNSFTDDAGNKRNPYVPVPALVTVEDKELGLIRLHWLDDFRYPGKILDVIPGEAVDEAFYFDDLGQGMTVLGRGGLIAAHGLKEDWEMSCVMSIVPLGENDKTRLYRKRYTPPNGTPEGDGPPLEVFSNVDTARFALSPEHGPYLGPDRLAQTQPEQAFQDNIVRGAALGTAGAMVNSKIIEAINLGESDRLYLTYNPQLEGQVRLGWTKNALQVRPVASLQNVAYNVDPEGRLSVTMKAQRLTQAPNLVNMLPEPVLRYTFKQVQFTKAQGS